MGQTLSLPGLGQMARAAAVAVVLFVEGVDAQGIMVSTFSGKFATKMLDGQKSSGSSAQDKINDLQQATKGYADGTGANAKFNDPGGIDITPDGKFALVADTRNGCLRKIDLATKAVTTLTAPQCTKWMGCMADGVGKEAKMVYPNDIHISSDGKFAMIADGYPNNRIRKLVLATNAVTTVATGFNRPKGVAISPDMKFILVADTNHKLLRKVDLGTKKVTTVAGDGKCGSCNCRARLDGKGMKAQFDNPTGVTISPDGKIALVADMYSIRKVVLATQVVSTLVGTGRPGVKDGVGTKASITDPLHIKISADGKFAVFSGNGNGIRKIDMETAAVTTLAGAGVGGSGTGDNAYGFTNGKAKEAKFRCNGRCSIAMPKDAYMSLPKAAISLGREAGRRVLDVRGRRRAPAFRG